jgi:surfeit locus 1 family protein
MVRWLSLFARRSTLIPTIALFALVAATLALGNWQLRRADEKAQLARARDRALEQGTLDLPLSPTHSPELEGRLARVRGRYDPESSIFLDNRTHLGQAGFHVITALVPEAGGPRVLVLRGWIGRDPADRNRRPELLTPTGLVSIEGLVVTKLAQSLQLSEPMQPNSKQWQWQYFDLQMYAKWLAQPVEPFILRQMSPIDDRLIREWTHPADGVDKHRAYALQWYSMAAALTIFGAFAAFRISQNGALSLRAKEPS